MAYLRIIAPAACAITLAYGAYLMFYSGNQMFALLFAGFALLCAWFASDAAKAWWYSLRDPLY